MSDPRALVEAFAEVVRALAPLEPEPRRRVIEAVHALLPIGRGTSQGRDRKRPRARRR